MRNGVETQTKEPLRSCAIFGVPVSCSANSEGQGSGRTHFSSGVIRAGNGTMRWRAIPPKYGLWRSNSNKICV